MEYLDKPLQDGTRNSHPAYWRGKSAGISETLKIVSDIMLGHDNGSGVNNNKDIELMRQSLLTWRDNIDKNNLKKVDK